MLLNILKKATQSQLLVLCCLKISLHLLLLLVLDIRLHIGDHGVDIGIIDLVLGHLHGILDHLVDQLHPLLLGSIGAHIGIELLDTDLVLRVAHYLGHPVHHVRHLVHRLHRLQST